MIKLIFTKALLGASHHAKVFTHVSTTCSYCSLWNKHVSCFIKYFELYILYTRSIKTQIWDQIFLESSTFSTDLLDMAKDLYFLSASVFYSRVQKHHRDHKQKDDIYKYYFKYAWILNSVYFNVLAEGLVF